MSRFDSVLGGGRRPQARTSTVGRPREDALRMGKGWPVVWLEVEATS